MGGRAARADELVERTAAQPTSTSRPLTARTPRLTAKSTTKPLTGCAIDNVPEPPSNHLDCETWEVAYMLIAAEAGTPPRGFKLTRIDRELYPAIECAAQVCRVSPTLVVEFIFGDSEQLEQEGKPSALPDVPISYLVGAVSLPVFEESVQMTGGCTEAIAFLVGRAN